VLEDFPVSKVTKDKVLSTSGHEIPYNLLMLIPPFHGQARLSENRITDKSGFVEVDEYLQIKNMKNAYAVGDIISFTGPKLAHIAVGQAQFVAENIQLAVEGKDPEAIYYHEIAAIIDQGGADSIYLHYGVPDENIYLLKKGSIWGLIKRIHDKLWVTKHRKVWFEKGL
jgi:sulfide:quinone oxidoreductase